jgi:hypothetical protein
LGQNAITFCKGFHIGQDAGEAQMSKDETLFDEATRASKKMRQQLRKRDRKTKQDVKRTDEQTFEDIRQAKRRT